MEDLIIEAFEHCMAGELDEAQVIVDRLLVEEPEDEQVQELAAHLAHLRSGGKEDPQELVEGMRNDGVFPGQAGSAGAGASTSADGHDRPDDK